jgi:hypothetical protein
MEISDPAARGIDRHPYGHAFEDIAAAALHHLKTSHPAIRFYLVDTDFWEPLFNLAAGHKLDLLLLPFGARVPEARVRRPYESPLSCIEPNDTIGIIGRPSSILGIIDSLPQMSFLIATIPQVSHSLRVTFRMAPLPSTRHIGLCYPFIVHRDYIRLMVGDFSSFFLRRPIYELKALKSALICLAFRFGQFVRVYAAGRLSSMA